MKTMKRLLVLFIGIALVSVVTYADEDNVSYYELPEKARTFLEKHFGKSPATKEVEKDRNGFSVELRSGYELEFDTTGKLVEIDAPGKKTLTMALVKDIIPAKAVKHLQDKGVLKKVDNIKLLHNGDYLVGIEQIVKEYTIRFNSNGEPLNVNK